jgi:hypothetical protein
MKLNWDALHSLNEGHHLADVCLFLAVPNPISHESGLNSYDLDPDLNPDLNSHNYPPLYLSSNP